MASIFNKLKHGAQDATKMAQASLEISQLKTQISNKEVEIKSLQLEVGQLVFDSYERDNFSENEQKIFSLCKRISTIKLEISQLEQKIYTLRDEKTCPSCRTITSLSTKFCSNVAIPLTIKQIFKQTKTPAMNTGVFVLQQLF